MSSSDSCDLHVLPPLTASALLKLCSLPPSSSLDDRTARLGTLELWRSASPDHLAAALVAEDASDGKSGCSPLHWAAGTGFDEAVSFILGCDARLVEQRALHPSTGRRPLHYAARNGHVSTCKLLLSHGAEPNPACSRGGVTPLQLATWQNRLDVVRLLVESDGGGGGGGAVARQRNDFNCGLMHWVGLVPEKRWGGTEGDGDGGGDGGGVLPLARYLHSLGVTYTSTAENANSQGHTPLHKAAWGGNLALLRYFRDEHSVYDDVQDVCGNFGADLARMRGHSRVHRWLQEHCSTRRFESCRVLGLDAASTEAEIKERYFELARACHPDKSGSGDSAEFVSVKAAFLHLMGGGAGNQSNPKYDDLKLLTDAERIDGTEDGGAGSAKHDDDLFCARVLAVISDYGDKGFPISLMPKRWNQIWPDRPFPPPEEYVIEIDAICSATGTDTTIRKRVKFVRFLKWKCGKAVKFRKVGGDVLAFKALV